MSQFDNKKAAALKYDGGSRAPVVLAAGSGYVAQKIIDVAQKSDIPVYQDNSLATLLSQLNVGKEIPPELYQAIVEIYVYFLKYVPNEKGENTLPEDSKKVSDKNGKNRKLDIVSEPDISVSDLSVTSSEEKEKTFTLDELREEQSPANMNIDLLENLLEDF